MTAPELDIRVPLATLAQFSADGQVYRAYAHAIAAGPGWVVLVPIELVDGDLTTVIDKCPVPWEEVLSLIDGTMRGPGFLFHEEMWAKLRSFASTLAPSHWYSEDINIGVESWVTRLAHPSGIRVGVLNT